MKMERRVYGYYPVHGVSDEIRRDVESMGKIVSKIGFCVGILTAGGYYLYKKVNNLTKDVKKMKEEMGK